MDPRRVGMDVRFLRRERGWTQARLAAATGMSRSMIVRLEGGSADDIDVGDLARVVAAVGGYLSVRVIYRGEGLDRLRDRRHAAIVDRVIALLHAHGWIAEPEISFNVFGERGSVDILAYHPSSGALLIIEVKTVIPDLGGMLATLDRKARLARGMAERREWDVRTVSRLLIVADTRTARRRVSDHAATFDAAFPVRTVASRRWIRSPVGPISGLMFVPDVRPHDTRPR